MKIENLYFVSFLYDANKEQDEDMQRKSYRKMKIKKDFK